MALVPGLTQITAEVESKYLLIRYESDFADYEGPRLAFIDRCTALQQEIELCHRDASSLCRWTNTAVIRGVLTERAEEIAKEICALGKEVAVLRQKVEKYRKRHSPTQRHIDDLCRSVQERCLEFQPLWQELSRLEQQAEADEACSTVFSLNSSFCSARRVCTPSEGFSPERILRVVNGYATESAEVSSEDESERGRSTQRQRSPSPDEEMFFPHRVRDVAAIRERIRWEMADEGPPEQPFRFREHSTNDHFEYIDEALKANRAPIPPSIEAPANMYWVYYVQMRDGVDRKN